MRQVTINLPDSVVADLESVRARFENQLGIQLTLEQVVGISVTMSNKKTLVDYLLAAQMVADGTISNPGYVSPTTIEQQLQAKAQPSATAV